MASRQTLKNDRYQIIGYVETDRNGEQTITDEKYHTLGYYDPRTNTTKDRQFRRIGYGNLLTTLLPGR